MKMEFEGLYMAANLACVEDELSALGLDAFRDHAQPQNVREAMECLADAEEALADLFGAGMEDCMMMDGKEDQIEAIAKARKALAKIQGE